MAASTPQIFYLKYRDTRPILEAALKNPDGTAYDLTGSADWRLHVWLADGSKLVRTMAVYGPATNGVVRYTWIATDWNAASAPDAENSYTIGGLVVGPTLPLAVGQREHRMEYEIVGPSPVRLTFPNGGYDTLRITTDIGQA
jgi:hypothetical protein